MGINFSPYSILLVPDFKNIFTVTSLTPSTHHGISVNRSCSRVCPLQRFMFLKPQQPIVCYGLLIFEALWSHTHTQTQTHILLCRTPLEEWSARRRNLYLTNDNTHKIQTSKASVGFEPTIATSKRPQTYALEQGATLHMLQKQNAHG
jgi:hypothetical protein